MGPAIVELIGQRPAIGILVVLGVHTMVDRTESNIEHVSPAAVVLLEPLSAMVTKLSEPVAMPLALERSNATSDVPNASAFEMSTVAFPAATIP